MLTHPRINLSSTPDNDTFSNRWPTGFLQPRLSLRCEPDGKAVATAGTSAFLRFDDPLSALEWMSKTFPMKGGRWVGHLSYDLGRWLESLPAPPPDDLGLPLFHFHYCVPLLDRSNFAEPQHRTSGAPLTGTFTRSQYEAAVRRAIEYIAAGDMMQLPGQTYDVKVTWAPGTYYYQCDPHALLGMKGHLKVE